MIIRGALLAALLLPTMASAQSQCAGIAALTGADGHQLRDISLREGRGGGIAIFAGRRQVALPDAENCAFEISDEGTREFTCYYRELPIGLHGPVGRASLTPEAAFEQAVSTLRTCMPAAAPVDAQRSPLYRGATDVFALQRMRHRVEVPGGATEIDVTLIERNGEDDQVYTSVSIVFDAQDDLEGDDD